MEVCGIDIVIYVAVSVRYGRIFWRKSPFSINNEFVSS